MEIIPFISSLDETLQTQWIDALNQCSPDRKFILADQLSRQLKQESKFAVVANPHRIQFNDFENLNWVHSLWAGVENLIPTARSNHFEVIRLIDPNLAERMSSSVLTYTLYLHQHIPQYRQQQNKALWRPLETIDPVLRNVSILGLGQLGQISARRLVENGFNVSGWSRNNKEVEGVVTFSGDDGLRHMLASTHILINLLPLTAVTKGLLNKELFATMPVGGSLINFARGAIINDDDLIDAMDTQYIHHAVLDTFAVEPLPTGHPYWSHPSVTVLPHVSATTNLQTAIEIVNRNISNITTDQNFDSVASALVNQRYGY